MTQIQDLIFRYFPPDDHPYRVLQRRIDHLLAAGATVLDIGCGRAAPDLMRLRGRARRLIGVDLVPFIAEDPALELLRTSVTKMRQLSDNIVDLAYSRAVMEHLDDP